VFSNVCVCEREREREREREELLLGKKMRVKKSWNVRRGGTQEAVVS